MDWREPLYECAVKTQARSKTDTACLCRAISQYAFLGAYRDCTARKQACEAEYERRYNRVLEVTKTTKSLAKWQRAFRVLSLFQDHAGFEQQKALAQKREMQLQRLEKLRRRTARIALIGYLIFMVLLSFRFNDTVIEPSLLQASRRLAAEGEYEDAAEHYKRIRYGQFSQEAEEQIPILMKKAAWQKMQGRSYDEAFALIQEYATADELRVLQEAATGQCVEGGDYEEACRICDLMKDTARKKEVCSSWAEVEAKDGDFFGAVEILEKGKGEDDGDDDLYQEQLTDLRRQRAQQAIEEMEAFGTSPEKRTVNHWKAAQMGEKLDDLDGQLLYCQALYEAGYDLSQVYPEGVRVKNLSPQLYMPTGKNRGIRADQVLKVLPFARKEVDEIGIERSESMYAGRYYEYLTSLFQTDSLPWSRTSPDAFELRLLPDILYQIPDSVRAKSGSDCTAYLFRDTFYSREGSVRVREEGNRNSLGWNVGLVQGSSYFPLLTAIDNVTLYVKDEPDRFLLVDYRRQLSPLSEQQEKEREESETEEAAKASEGSGPEKPQESLEGREGKDTKETDSYAAAMQLLERMRQEKEVVLPDGNLSQICEALKVCWGKSDPVYLDQTMQKAVVILQSFARETFGNE